MVVDYWEHSYKILFTHKSHRTGSCFVRWLLHITHRIILSRTATQASVFPTLSIAKGIFAFRSERDAGSRAGANVICREIEPIRSSSTRPAKWTALRKNRPTATPLLFFVHANPPGSLFRAIHSEVWTNPQPVFSSELHSLWGVDKCFFLFRFANLYVYPHVFSSEPFSPEKTAWANM